MAFDAHAFFTDPETSPPIFRVFGWTLKDFDVERGWLRVGFRPGPQFLNPAGFVQGGIVTAMLDDTMGPAVIVMSSGELYSSSIDLHTHFLRPVFPGEVIVEASVTRLGKTIAYMAGELFDDKGKLCARATTSAMVQPFPKR